MGRRSKRQGKDKLFLHLSEHNPKAFVLHLSVCIGYPPLDQVGRNPQHDTPLSTAQSQHWLILQELRSPEQHSTFYILQDSSLLPARVPPALSPHSIDNHAASPFCRGMHKGWDKEKRADFPNIAITPGKGRERSLPMCPVGRKGGGSTWSRMAGNPPAAGRGSSPPSLWAEKSQHWVISQQMPPVYLHRGGRNYLLTVICININPSPASEDTWWDCKFLAYNPIQFYCYRFCKVRPAQHPNTANLSHGARVDCRPMQWALSILGAL